jgi:hypothetical protein
MDLTGFLWHCLRFGKGFFMAGKIDNFTFHTANK